MLFAICLCVFVVACDNETKVAENKESAENVPENAISATLAISYEKTLTSTVNRDIKYWEFMATPLFTLNDAEKVYGKVSYWRPLDALDTTNGVVKTSCDLGRYTPGEWLFELRSLNSNHQVVSVGSIKKILKSGQDNIVNIVMYNDIADKTHGNSKDNDSRITQKKYGTEGVETIKEYGSVTIVFDINKLDENSNNVSIVLTKQKINTGRILSTAEKVEIDWSREELNNGRVRYETTIPNVDAGAYVFTVSVVATSINSTDIPIAGQSVTAYVIGGEETKISGSMLANEHILQALKINKSGKIYGSINGKDDVTGYEKAADSTLPIKLEFKQTEEQKQSSAEEIVSCVWIADGTVLENENGTSLEFSCPVITTGDGENAVEKRVYGIYRVTCIAIGEQGSLGKASLDVIFNPPEGPDAGEEYPWPEDWV